MIHPFDLTQLVLKEYPNLHHQTHPICYYRSRSRWFLRNIATVGLQPLQYDIGFLEGLLLISPQLYFSGKNQAVKINFHDDYFDLHTSYNGPVKIV